MSTSRPILFSAPMVRAILAGTKTQTRRIVKPQPSASHWETVPGYELKHRIDTLARSTGPVVGVRFRHTIPQNTVGTSDPWIACKQGRPGDTLWVRETWMKAKCPVGMSGAEQVIRGPVCDDMPNWQWCTWFKDSASPGGWPVRLGWKPSIHMPRWASRINLAVLEVRVERLQDISREDAIAEGVMGLVFADFGKDAMKWPPAGSDPVTLYRHLWESINGPGSWAANPWVFVVHFTRS